MGQGSKTKAAVSARDGEALRAWVAAEGERAVVAAVGLSRMGIYRVLSGLPVTVGTRAVLREAFARREEK